MLLLGLLGFLVLVCVLAIIIGIIKAFARMFFAAPILGIIILIILFAIVL